MTEEQLEQTETPLPNAETSQDAEEQTDLSQQEKDVEPEIPDGSLRSRLSEKQYCLPVMNLSQTHD